MGNRYIKEEIKKGTKFNNWTVIKEVKPLHGRMFLCVNSTGIRREVALCHLKSGASKGTFEHYKTHGMSKTRHWQIWMSMKARCFNKNENNYKHYGGRGITICEEWLDFTNFWRDMEEGYTDEMTIERIDVNGNYCKENCTWATRKEQTLNKRNSIIIEYKGEKKPLKKWAEELDINYKTLRQRLFVYNYSVEKAFKKTNYSGKSKKRGTA